VLQDQFQIGMVHSVVRLLDERHVEVTAPGQSPKIVLTAPCAGELKKGDRALLDPCGAIIVRNLGPEEPDEGPGVETGVDWDDIGGLEEAKRELREAIAGPVEDKALYARYGRKPKRGVLLSGAPGCGKTYMAKAAATELARLHGKKFEASGYVYQRGPQALNMFVGKSEENVRKLFEDARRHKAKHGYPAIICLDEADGLLARRGAARMEGMERTVVPTFLAEMDGLDDAAAFVMVLTNRPDMLDPGITRDGRLDIKIHVRRPTKAEAIDITAKHLRGKPLAKDLAIPKAAELAAEELFSQKHVLYMLRTRKGLGERFTLGDLVSGAMMAGLVDRAVGLAMRREKDTGEEGGIQVDDILGAVRRIHEEQQSLEHPNDLAPLIEKLGDEFKTVDKVRPSTKAAA
jgi:proteasome-associated ATPase